MAESTTLRALVHQRSGGVHFDHKARAIVPRCGKAIGRPL